MARRRRLAFDGVAEPVAIGATARAILHKTVDDGVADLEMAKAIRLDLIEPDPEQPRKHFDGEALAELAQSIRVQGVLQPIVVEWMAERERFRIISGERRWRAAQLAAQEPVDGEGAPARLRPEPARIPAIIRNPTAVDRYIQQLYENEQRQDYSDVERAFAYERLKELLDVTWEELAAKLGLSKGRIHQIRRTKNRLSPAVQRDITDGRLSSRHAVYLTPLAEPVQEAVAQAVQRKSLTHQQTARLVQHVRARLPLAEPGPQDTSPPSAHPQRPPAGERPASSTEQSTPGAAAAEPPPADADGVTCHTIGLAALVDQAVTEIAAESAPRPRAGTDDAARVLALARQLVRLEVQPPAEAEKRGQLVAALDELLVWANSLRERLRTGKV